MKKKPVIWMALSLMGLTFIFTKVFPPVGFCAAEFRFPTDEEYITKVLSVEFAGGEMLLDKEDTSPSAYYRRHPECCGVARNESVRDHEVNFFDTDFVDVSVGYTPTQAAEVREGGDGHLETRSNLSKFYLLNGCGESLGNPMTLLESVH